LRRSSRTCKHGEAPYAERAQRRSGSKAHLVRAQHVVALVPLPHVLHWVRKAASAVAGRNRLCRCDGPAVCRRTGYLARAGWSRLHHGQVGHVVRRMLA
jgi:hypothetical protein